MKHPQAENSRERKIAAPAVIFLAVLIAGFLAGYVVRSYETAETSGSDFSSRPAGYELREGPKNLTNPLLMCEMSDNKQEFLSHNLEYAIRDDIAKEEANNDGKQISVYFRDMDEGRWIGFGEDVKYAAASMLKVPLMIAYFKQAESDPSTLDKKITFAEAVYHLRDQNYPPSEHLKKGTAYTVSQLIEYMIKYSGNNAMNLLFNNIDPNAIKKVFSDLGLLVPDFNDPGDIISAKSYAMFFRALYNATYLDRAFSERALGLLAETDFDRGLVAGVPAGKTIAHKFGERGLPNDDGTVLRELHDCGIIYASDPYLLCVMTKGGEWAGLEKAISAISDAVYKQVAGGYQ